MSCVTGSHDTDALVTVVSGPACECGREVVDQVRVASPSRPLALAVEPDVYCRNASVRQTRRARRQSCSTRSWIWSVTTHSIASGATCLEAMPGCRRRQHAPPGVASSAMARARSRAASAGHRGGIWTGTATTRGVKTTEECGDEVESRRIQQQRTLAGRDARLQRRRDRPALPIELAPRHRERTPRRRRRRKVNARSSG